MDRLIYVAMTGAKYALSQQATTAHNLANASTPGFRAEVSTFRAVPVTGEGLPTRAFVVEATTGADFRPGAIQQTGRELDVAINGRGFLAVQSPDGREAYTRHGSLEINANGVLQTRAGLPVLGDGGPISIPPDTQVAIAKDGTITAVGGANRTAVQVVGRLKLASPEERGLERGPDGLFRSRDGQAAAADSTVTVVPGSIEGSNVNVVEAMVNMIAAARSFEMQTKLMSNVEANSRQAGQILSLNR